MRSFIASLMSFILLATTQAFADDVAIYGTQPVTLEPNVLIIFDNSGSMKEEDVPVEPYDPGTVYSGSYEAKAGYYWLRQHGWTKFTNDVDNIACVRVKNALKTNGYTRDRLRSDLTCGGNRYNLRIGNYLNHEDYTGGVTHQSRLEAAKTVVKELLADVTGVRFGLMVFNTSHGGYVKNSCGTASSIISSNVSGLTASTWTPLAETLAEAGLYFAGESSYFNSGVYTTPIQHRCQKNYVIIVTDGEPTMDRNELLYNKIYYSGKKIGDYNNDGKDLDSSGRVIEYPIDGNDYDSTDFLDDVAGFLYSEDMHTMGSGTSFEKQNIVTHTIGFKINHDLLRRTAQEGGGSYHTANTASSLKEAFVHIISTIVEESSVFVAPVVPVNRLNRTSDGNYIYLAFFKPMQSGEWLGNLKKYGLSNTGEIIDANGEVAVTSDGLIKGNSWSLWATAADGNDVATGGAGAKIASQVSRNFYTYTGTKAELTDSSNAFTVANAAAVGATAAEITDTRDGIGATNWPIGSIIHSEPAVVHYSTTQSVIYFGSNDGILRCIDDATGQELWAFVPPGQLSRLGLLSDSNYDYYVDGAPAVSTGARISGTDLFAPETLMIGERRGGSLYYVLDIQDRLKPRWKYDVKDSFLLVDVGGTLKGETLGQSWGTPQYRKIMGTGGTSELCYLLPGGYDTQQDAATPSANDSVGRAIFSVNVSTGMVGSLNVSAYNWSDMTHSIVSIHSVDPQAKGLTTRIYAADMASQVFVVADDITITGSGDDREVKVTAATGAWAYRNRLFKGPAGKSFYAPVPADVKGFEALFFGTGNREHPLGTTGTDRFYSVKNTWLDTDLTESNLLNVTDTTVDFLDPDDTANYVLGFKGWYINLTNAGEKVVSQAKVDSGIVYFTTYTPDSGSGSLSSDPCAGTGARGTGRLYAVRAIDGKPVTEWGDPNSPKKRSTELPPDLPIAVPIIKNRKIHLGPKTWDLPDNDRVKYFYWKNR